MKHLLTITLLLVSFFSFGQITGPVLDSTWTSKIKWVHGPAIESFRLIPADTSKCKHIYVAVEQPEVSGEIFSVLSIGKVGKHEGKEIVCLKCHHVRRQIVDYGQGGQLQLGPRFTLENRPGDILNVDLPKKQ